MSIVLAMSGVAPANAQEGRAETAVRSTSPVTDVIETVVSLPAPLPPAAGQHPPECDRLSYLRFRAANGPADAADADRILVAQPGIFEGAGAFESVARNTVSTAAAAGRYIEFWALDRRSNCLEDHAGVAAALRTGDLDVATDYYFHKREVDGRRFAGYADGAQTEWLRGVGLEQTLRDQYELLRRELPDPAVRANKVLCGGHSLGGFVTGFFAQWDFDGNPATLDDAGFAQCAGYFALDTVVDAALPVPGFGPLDLPAPVAAPLAAVGGVATGALPVLRLPAVINPETTNLLALTGLAARLNPEGVNDIVARLPHNTNVDLSLRTLLAGNFAMFATGSPDVRTLNATNDAVLGSIMDDNSMILGFIQASVGFVRGPVVPKSFPVPNEVLSNPLMRSAFGNAPKVSPAEFSNPVVVYGWDDYDEVVPGPFTGPANEITSIRQLARSLCEQPLDFTEWYFPTQLVTDLSAGNAPALAAHRLHRDGVLRHPVFTAEAKDGLIDPPRARAGDVVLVMPGYNHIDLLTAAAKQNDGRPEQVSTALAAFATRPVLR
ncbi:hypothetical protein [Aldersonia kunmingensis]|uniref:hypothetical protein n=1 Tax=Aldersonia kunmingensis TaxID=408066 RepID=UPI001FE165B0|nr:hypothetical protein [Aldersonia kunmingensis]